MVVLIAAHAQELEGALHHAQRRIAIPVQDAIAEASVIGADTHGRTVLLANAHQRKEPITNTLQLGVVFHIGVLAHIEFLLVHVIAGVHAHLLHDARGDLGSVRREMDVRHQRCGVALRAQLLLDDREVLRFLLAGCSDAHQLTSRFDHSDALGHSGSRVHGIRGGHALHPDGVVATDADVADTHSACAPTFVTQQAGAIEHVRHGCAKLSAGVRDKPISRVPADRARPIPRRCVCVGTSRWPASTAG